MQLERVRLEESDSFPRIGSFEQFFSDTLKHDIFHVVNMSFLLFQINNRHMLFFIALLINKCYYNSGSHKSLTQFQHALFV